MTGVMGFIAQCEICPQKAILTDQPDGWVCPRCTAVTAPAFAGGFGDVDVAHAEPITVVGNGIRLPIDDPLAVAIAAECERSPQRPLITAFVKGRRFIMRGWTRTPESFTADWADYEADLARYRVPPELLAAVQADDDEYDVRKIRG